MWEIVGILLFVSMISFYLSGSLAALVFIAWKAWQWTSERSVAELGPEEGEACIDAGE